MLCSGLQEADEYGLVPDMPQPSGDIEEPKEVSSEGNHPDFVSVKHETLTHDLETSTKSNKDNIERTDDIYGADDEIDTEKKPLTDHKTTLHSFLTHDQIMELVQHFENIDNAIIKKDIKLTKKNSEDDRKKSKEEEGHNDL